MIYVDNRQITGMHVGDRDMVAVHSGARLVWSSVRSCFGSGIWVGERPWLGEEKWKDNR